MKKLLWFAAIFLAATGLKAQYSGQEGHHMHGEHVCNHESCGLQALNQDMNTHIGTPAGFVPGADRAVVINVTYNGFSPAAQTAFQYAVDIWASQLTSAVPINVTANWTPLAPATLGSAGPTTVWRDFAGAPVPSTWYSVALANSLNGGDLDPAAVDINCNFNSTFGNWYLGTDGNCPPGNYDFVTVVLHELCHGFGFLGFASYTAPNGTIGTAGFNSIWERFVETGPGTDIITLANPGTVLGTALTGNDLWWNGPLGAAPIGTRPRTYAPAVWAPGSSYSHLDEGNFPAGDPNSLMTYALGTAEVIHNPGPVVLGMFDDMGWAVGNPGCTDPYACNYNPLATIDDGSCDFSGAQWWMPNDINAFPFPVIWSCNAIPNYTLSPYQSCVQQIVNADPYCQNTDWDNICEIALQAIIGCTNPYACNYDPSAQCDDGSCDFSSAQWWLPNDINAPSQPAILSCNAVPNYTLAAYQYCAAQVISLDPYCVNVDWDSICQDAYDAYVGCSDPAACNYEPGALCDDGTCTYPGCTNGAACNYNPAAGCDDGSCIIAPSNDVCSGAIALGNNSSTFVDNSLTCIDGPEPGCGGSGIRDIWYSYTSVNGGNLQVTTVLNGSMVDSRLAIYDACGGSVLACNDDFGGSLASRVTIPTTCGTTYYIQFGGYNSAIGSAYLNIFEDVVYGCSDINACNYAPSNPCAIELCTYPGCTDPAACNYNPNAGCDDGSCFGNIPASNTFQECFFDNNLDCIQDGDVCSAYYYATNFNASSNINADRILGITFNFTMTSCAGTDMTISINGNPVYTQFVSGCACGGVSSVSLSGAQLAGQISGNNFIEIIWNSEVYISSVIADITTGENVLGCIDGAACNFNPAATCDDGSCTYPGCTNPSACNYNPAAGCDDGSCVLAGCTDPAACNYDASAGCDDGSCQTLDCAGVCGGNAQVDECGNCILATSCSATVVFNYTGAEQQFIVPDGVTELFVAAYGAQGGSSYSCDPGTSNPDNDGGLGGYAAGMLSVAPYQVLYINVGGQGGVGEDGPFEGGWNGGGAGGYWGAGGGGASDIRLISGDLYSRVVVAGGGGGGNTGCPDHGAGGAGGGLSGGAGLSNFGFIPGGGGSQVIGGSAGDSGAPGSFGLGGSTEFYHMAGGGGGWYGGGSAYAAGGGGGSSMVGLLNGGLTSGGVNAGNGSIYITYSTVEYLSDCNTGCNDPNAINYDAEANFDNGSCLYLDECQNVINTNGDGSGFFGSMDPSNWIQNIGGNGSVSFTNNAVSITGSNSLQGIQILNSATIVAPVTGTYTFDWSYYTTEALPLYDPGFYLNGTYYQLTSDYGPVQQIGSVSISVNEGDLLGFGINSLDDVAGSASLTVTNFTYPVSCVFGCTDVNACNYDPAATNCDDSCIYPIAYYLDCGGICLNDSDNDGTCDELEIFGCDDPAAINYNFNVTENDGSCLYAGCTDPVALNYFPAANFGDNSCIYQSGCTYPDANNYDPAAIVDDGSCVFPAGPNTCPEDIDGNGQVNTGDLLQLLGAFGTLCP